MQSARSLGRLAGTLHVLVAAACGDRLVEWFAQATSAGRYVDRGHQAVLPTVMLAIAAAIAAAAWCYLERSGASCFENALRAARARGPHGQVARAIATAAGAAALALAMEAVERRLGGGAPFGGLPIVGMNALALAAIFVACAAATSSAVARAVAAIVDALDAVVRTVAAVLVWIARRTTATLLVRPTRSMRRSFARLRADVARCHGDRAPPIPTFATTR